MDFLLDLNDSQRRAVEAGKGPVLIVAGPGTGKTKTLTARMAYLLQSKQAKPDEMVALTFTNKAGREMRERLEKVLGGETRLPRITTFHALGADLLMRQGSDEKLLAEQERMEIIHALAKSVGLKGMNARELGLLISRAKTSLHIHPDESTRKLLRVYEAVLYERGLHDFDDLLTKTFELLQADQAKRPGYTYVLVDEFQDTSELQYELLKLLGAGENVFAIGDPNQSIYAFRGAGAEMFERLQRDYPNVQTTELTMNYRSRPEIITLANAVFPETPQLEANLKNAGSVHVVQVLNEYGEAAYVINEIERGIGGSDMLKAQGHEQMQEPRSFAVLYRTHRAARTLQKAFAESGIPYQVAGEDSPYGQPEIQAIMALMRYAQSPDESTKQQVMNLVALKRPSLAQINALLVKLPEPDGMSVYDFAAKIAEIYGFGKDEQHQNLQQFLGSLVQFGSCEAGGLEACLKHIEEISESEFYDPTVNAVALLTIHAAKGLEFGHVFLLAAEDGILPKLKANGEGSLDEERRLFYVAVTRAKETLEILHTKTRIGKPSKLSRFVSELPEATLPRVLDPDMAGQQRRLAKRRLKRAQQTLF